MTSQPQLGWQCPHCKTVYAPFVMKCECCKVAKHLPKDPPSPPFSPEDLERLEKRMDEAAKKELKQRPFYPPPPFITPEQPYHLDRGPTCL